MFEIVTEVVIILSLCVLNGFFAMSELAVVSAIRQRLAKLAEDGNKKAKKVLEISNNSAQFLASVQIGITLIGILAGVFGGATLAEDLTAAFRELGISYAYAQPLAFILVVGSITYISLIFGELVPKQIALSYPEKVAMLATTPFRVLSYVTKPAVWLLERSSKFVTLLLPFKVGQRSEVSQEDIHNIIEAGAAIGEISDIEKDIALRLLKLNDRPVSKFMTPRREVVWLDANTALEQSIKSVLNASHSFFPVAERELDKLLGIVSAKDLIALHNGLIEGKLSDICRQPLMVPHSARPLNVLEQFKQERRQIALVVDEFGGIDGVVTTHDLFEALVGDLPDYEGEAPHIIVRADGSYLVSGNVSLSELADHLPLLLTTSDYAGPISGLILKKLGRVPTEGDHIVLRNYLVEVIDMDGGRIDKVIITTNRDRPL